MTHPFANQKVLTAQQIHQVTGAALDNGSAFREIPTPGTPIVKPPIGTTLAIGEEGGSLPLHFN